MSDRVNTRATGTRRNQVEASDEVEMAYEDDNKGVPVDYIPKKAKKKPKKPKKIKKPIISLKVTSSILSLALGVD